MSALGCPPSHRPRGAVSPIIATPLLIIISSSAAAVMYGFSMGYTSRPADAAAVARARLKVDAVEVVKAVSDEGDLYNVKAYVANIGSVAVTVDAMYLYSAAGAMVARALSEGSIHLWLEGLSG